MRSHALKGMEMAEDSSGEHSNLIFIKQPSSADIRARQSVRATFKLSAKAIHAVSIVSVHLGIKQKSLFDFLFEDAQFLNQLTKGIVEGAPTSLNRVQKTYVLSRKTLNTLEEISQTAAMTRDMLVEYTINRLEAIITVEKEKHRIRKEVLDEMTAYHRQGKKLLRKAIARLGMDDPVCQDLANAVRAAETAYQNMEKYIDKGSIIEGY